MKISVKGLEEWSACSDGIKWYKEHCELPDWKYQLAIDHPAWYVWCWKRFDGFSEYVDHAAEHLPGGKGEKV